MTERIHRKIHNTEKNETNKNQKKNKLKTTSTNLLTIVVLFQITVIFPLGIAADYAFSFMIF